MKKTKKNLDELKDTDDLNNEIRKKKKKKKKRQLMDNDLDSECNPSEKEVDVTEVKEKKPKAGCVSEDTNTKTSEAGLEDEDVESSVKKKKKKKVKKNYSDDEQIAKVTVKNEDDCQIKCDDNPTEDVDKDSSAKKKKKKKRKCESPEKGALLSDVEDSSERKVKKHSKKRKHEENNEKTKEDSIGEETKPSNHRLEDHEKQEQVFTGQWSKASLGDDQRNEKFLRLMGGFKAKNASSVGNKKLFSSVAMDAKKENRLYKGLQQQYEQAWETTRQNRGKGLGFKEQEEQKPSFNF